MRGGWCGNFVLCFIRCDCAPSPSLLSRRREGFGEERPFQVERLARHSLRSLRRGYCTLEGPCGVIGSYRWYHRRAVEARLRGGFGSIEIGTSRAGWVLLGFRCVGQWGFFCFGGRLALDARLLVVGRLRVKSPASFVVTIARRLRPGSRF